MMIDGDKLIRILENLKEQSIGQVAVLKEPAVYSRIIEIVKHMSKGVRPVPRDDHGYNSWSCPICDHFLEAGKDEYCKGCGSRINWEA